MEAALHNAGFQMLAIPKEALFLAGKAYLSYRKRKGFKHSPLPDFYIGAQAAVLGMELINRDERRYPAFKIFSSSFTSSRVVSLVRNSFGFL